MEQIQSVVSCKKVAAFETQETAGKKRKKAALAVREGYCVTFNTGLSVYFSSDEVAEDYFYEEAPLKHPFDTVMTRILFRRILTAVLPFVVFTKRTEMQVRRRVAELELGEIEPVWAQYREGATLLLMTYLKGEQYVDDERYVQSFLRSHTQKPTSKRSLSAELSKRGIAQGLIDAALADVEIDEAEGARVLFQKKFPEAARGRGVLSQKERAKIYRYLAGKGFSGETIRKVTQGFGEEDEVC